EASGETEAPQRAHANFYLSLSEGVEAGLRGPAMAEVLGRVHREHDNLRAALSWARAQRQTALGLRLAGALAHFWWLHGHLSEGRGWLESLLALTVPGDVPVALHARVLHGAGLLASAQGDFVRAVLLLEQALALYQECGNVGGAGRGLNSPGGAAFDQGELPSAGALLQQSPAPGPPVGDLGEAARVLGNMGEAIYHLGDLGRAAACYEETLALARQAGRVSIVASQLRNLGAVARRHGDLERAATLQRQSLELKRPLGDLREIALGLEQLAVTAAAAGQGRRAARLLGASAALRATIGAPLPPPEQNDVTQAAATARVALGEGASAAAYAKRRGWALDRAIQGALTLESSRQARPSHRRAP